jgi:dTDP-4-dehydrorhamnose reductase
LAEKKILVTGANGQLGNEFRIITPRAAGFEFVFKTSSELDIRDANGLSDFLNDHSFEYCINCAAYTAVDKAEGDQTVAYEVNAYAVRQLAKACLNAAVTLIHFSTDYVFNGKAYTPYKENDQTDPVNFYGHTKLQGEMLALQEIPALIIRTSWLYSPYGHNFVKTMIRLMESKNEIGVVNDQVGSPTYAADLASTVVKIISENEVPAPGIYHYCNKGVITWYDFATAIKEYLGSSCIVNPISTESYPTRAKRPAYSAFDTSKVEKEFGIIIPGWKESLWKCLGEMGIKKINDL